MSLALRRIWRAPAVQAALLQLAALPFTYLALAVAARLGLTPTLISAAVLQGLLAAVFAWRRGLAVWWRPIQLLFPVALVAMLGLALPPLVFLAGFAFLLMLYWSTFRTQVPFYPSGPRVWAAVAALLPPRPLHLIDIGSGLGGCVLELARRRPDSRFLGIELAPLPWLVSCLRARFTDSRARFLRGDYDDLDFAQFDVVFAYLSPAAMGALWRKAAAEMRPGCKLLSYEFPIMERKPDHIIPITPGGPALYVWDF